jgi:ribosomal protein L37AE/L43A
MFLAYRIDDTERAERIQAAEDLAGKYAICPCCDQHVVCRNLNGVWQWRHTNTRPKGKSAIASVEATAGGKAAQVRVPPRPHVEVRNEEAPKKRATT